MESEKILNGKKRLYSIKEASEILNLSYSTLKSWSHKKKFPVVRLGRRTMINDSVLESMIEGGLQAVQWPNKS